MFNLDDPEVEHFLTFWFASGEHQFGRYRDYKCTTLKEYVKFIKMCYLQNKPAFHSIQPMLKIEKLFWEFDTKIEGHNFTYDSPLLDGVWEQALKLVERVEEKGGNPLLCYSGNRGFHVWVYVQSEEVLEFTEETAAFGKRFYKKLLFDVLGDKKTYANFDNMPTHVNALARIPYSFHQKSKNQVIPLTKSREPFKPDLADYVGQPLDHTYVMEVEAATQKDASPSEEMKKLNKKLRYKKDWSIRTEIMKALVLNPSHNVRLAFLLDAIYAKKTDDEIHEYLKSSDNYEYFTTQYQIDYAREQIDNEGLRPVSRQQLYEWGIVKRKPWSDDQLNKIFGGKEDDPETPAQ